MFLNIMLSVNQMIQNPPVCQISTDGFFAYKASQIISIYEKYLKCAYNQGISDIMTIILTIYIRKGIKNISFCIH